MVDLDPEIVRAIRPALSKNEEETLDDILAAETIGELERIENGRAHMIILGDRPETTVEIDIEEFDDLSPKGFYWIEISGDEFQPKIDSIERDETIDTVMRSYYAEDSRQRAEQSESHEKRDSRDDVGLDDL